MVRIRELCRTTNGTFVRNLGWKYADQKYAQHKFHLGRDESKAMIANLHLEQLWQEACRRWERENPTALYPTERAVWDEVTLSIADAIRKGDRVAKIALPSPISAFLPESSVIGEWLDQLQSDISVIKIELADTQAQKGSEEYLQREGTRLMNFGRRLFPSPSWDSCFTRSNLHANLALKTWTAKSLNAFWN
jgi:hypothetical protein